MSNQLENKTVKIFLNTPNC